MIISFENMDNEQIQSYVLNSISNATERFYPYNKYIAYLLARKKNQELKTFVSIPSSLRFNSYFESLHDALPQEDIDFTASYYTSTVSNFNSQDLIYFYYGSSNSLFANVFLDILPSNFNLLYNYLCENNLIKKIGTNTGKAHLISSQIAFHDFSSFTTSFSFDNYPDAFQSLMKDFNSLKMDKEYLLTLLDQKDKHISDLNLSIDQINHNHYISSTYTWS